MFILSWAIAKYILKQYVTPLWLLWQPTLLFMGVVVAYYGLSTLPLQLLIRVPLKILLMGIFLYIYM